MTLDCLSKKPIEKTTKYLLILSLPMLILTAYIVIYLLELSNYPGTLNETQLGFSAEYIKSSFSHMSNEDMSIFVIANIFDYVFMIAYGTFFLV